MTWEGNDVLRAFRRLEREHARGQKTAYRSSVIQAALDWLLTCREIDRLLELADQPGQADGAAFRTAADALQAALPAKQRRLASALRLDGVTDWAAFLPGFDEEFPG